MHIDSLFIYPIKSLGGILLQSANLLERGFEYDRRWMLVDANGVFLTQREFPILALFSTQIGVNHILVKSKLSGDKVSVPLIPEGKEEIMVTVWDDKVPAVEVSLEVSTWFSNEIGKAIRLVYMPDNSERLIDANYANNSEIVSFADGYPVLVANTTSLYELNSRLNQSVTIDRFRPNIVVAGERPFEEDDWKSITIGTIQLSLVKKCARCVMVNINPNTAEKETSVLSVLASFRKKNNSVFFGINGFAKVGGIINVGDKVEIGL